MKAEVPIISVIVPMYNAEKYIEQAIDSVLDQTFKDVEVIVINDCSTDGSLELVRSRYENNPRVRLLHNRINRGSAITRNIGMRAANGKYIAMLDADDVYLPNALETLYNAAESHDADVVAAVAFLFSKSEEIARNFSGDYLRIADASPVERVTLIPPAASMKVKADYYLRGEFGFACCWSKLYRRGFLVENDILFPKHAEDRGFILQCALHSKTYVKIPTMINIYRGGIQSQSRPPLTLEGIAKHPKGMSDFAADFEQILTEFDFFKENLFYKYRIIESQLLAVDNYNVIQYYPSGQAINPNVIAAVCEKTPEAFGEHAPFVNWLFNRYHMYYRRCLELESKLK